ncbi:MAG TPA: hypothetical protein VGG29_05350 [Caulobacteraceae bacterium]|jgi:spore coat protein U-like protein
MSQRRRLALVLLACAALAPAGGAAAACVNFSGASISVTYDPLSGQSRSDLVQPISLTAARQTASPEPSAVVGQFVAQSGQSQFRLGGHDGPVYTVVTNDGTTVIVGQSAPPLQQLQYFAVGFPNSPTHVTETVGGLKLVVPGGQDVAAGTYQESLSVQYRCLAGGHDDVQTHGDAATQSAVLPVTITVPNKISANLAGGQSRGQIDFGDFDQLSHRVSIQVRSTGPYDLLISSDNNGKMLLDHAPKGADADSTSIGYKLSYGGAAVSLGSQGRFDRTGVAGDDLDLVVTADPVAKKRAGEYRDTLTVTFTPASI